MDASMKVSEFVEWWAAPDCLRRFKRELKSCWDWAVEDAQFQVMETLNMDVVELQREAANYYDDKQEAEEEDDY